MIQARPALKGKKLIYMPIVYLAVCVVLFNASILAGRYASLVQLAAIGFAAYGIFLLTKYVIPDYLYTIEGGHFTVHKINGKKSLLVADVELCDMKKEFMSKEQFKAKDIGGRVFYFIKNPDSTEIKYILCYFGTEECTLVIEIDERFENQLVSQIEEWKTKAYGEEDEDDE